MAMPTSAERDLRQNTAIRRHFSSFANAYLNMSLRDCAERCGMTSSTLQRRLNRGLWKEEEILRFVKALGVEEEFTKWTENLKQM